MSIEFLSRGAKEVISVDNNKNSINLIKQNFAKIKSTPNLLQGDYLKILKNLKGKKFDIIFLDPPFASDFGIKAILEILEGDLLEDNGIIVYEHSSSDNLKELLQASMINIDDTKKYGNISVDFLRIKENFYENN